MSTSTGLIIAPNLGFVPPKQYLQLAYAQFPSFWARVIRTEESGSPELVIECDDKLPPLEEMLKSLEDDKANLQLLYFANTKTKLTEESEQPFIIIRDEQKDPVLVGFIEGDYFTKQHAESVHTDEYHAYNDILGPQLNKIYNKMCDGDLAKLEEELDDDATVNMICSLAGARGVIMLQSLSDKTFRYAKGNDDLEGDFPWGWVSQKLGFEEKSSKDYVAMTPPEPKPERSRGLGASARFKKDPPVIADTKPTVVHKPDSQTNTGTTIAAQNAKTEGAAAVIEDAARPKIKPPADLLKKGKNRVYDWYDDNCIGPRPTKDQCLSGVEWPANDKWIAANSGKKFQKLADGIEHFKEKIEASKATPKDVPIITARMRKVVKDMLDTGEIKALIEKGRVLNKDDLASPPKTAPFSAQLGYELEKVFRWDDEVFEKFLRKQETENDFTTARLLFAELIWELQRMLLADSNTSEKKEAVNTDTKAEEHIKPPADDKPVDPPADTGRKTASSRFARNKAA